MEYFDDRISPYLPSLQPMWVETLGKRLDDYRTNVPHGSFRSLDEFNWYDGVNPRFSHPFGLYSPGHAELDLENARIVDRMLFDRDRDNTFLLVDSGGYQVGVRSWPINKLKTQIPKVIAWQEAIADLAVILEVPTWMQDDKGRRVPFEYALSETNANLEAYTRHASGKIKFIVPLHGLNFQEACDWFEGTRWFNEKGYGVGWCFSSAMSGDLSLALKVLLRGGSGNLDRGMSGFSA